MVTRAGVPSSSDGTALHDGMLVYDGDCAFCTSLARWATPRLRRGRVVANGDVPPAPSFGLAPDAFDRAVHWIDAEGRAFGGYAAVTRALRDIGGAYGVLGVVGRVPPLSLLGALVYRVVARHRHRLPGGSPDCRIER